MQINYFQICKKQLEVCNQIISKFISLEIYFYNVNFDKESGCITIGWIDIDDHEYDDSGEIMISRYAEAIGYFPETFYENNDLIEKLK